MEAFIRLPGKFFRYRLPGLNSHVILPAVALVLFTIVVFYSRSPDLRVVPHAHNRYNDYNTAPFGSLDKPLTDRKHEGTDILDRVPYWDLDASDIQNWRDVDDNEDPNDVEPGTERDGKPRDQMAISRLQDEKDKRKLWRFIYRATANLNTSNQIYGKTLATLKHGDNRTEEHAKKLVTLPQTNYKVGYTSHQPVHFDPYPAYNSEEWQSAGHAPYTECNGADGKPVQNVMVFKGWPADFPSPSMEQSTRANGRSQPLKWNNINWGKLQQTCVENNARRYRRSVHKENPYLAVYEETRRFIPRHDSTDKQQDVVNLDGINDSTDKQLDAVNLDGIKSNSLTIRDASPQMGETDNIRPNGQAAPRYKVENRTALLLRSYTGKSYTESDKQNIRALISELCLKSGGEYQVFLLVQVKDNSLDIFGSRKAYNQALKQHVPAEFHDITVLWNDGVVKEIYTEMKDDDERSVHTAQWLSVQKFSHDHPEFEYIWNWEMDFRYTGHHYDLVDNIQKFARKQPRKGLWERNERWYIPEHHGDYDTSFRESIELQYGEKAVWGPPDVAFITPQGPKPPRKAWQDKYEWGVGEEADVITVGPMFNPVNSLWIIGDNVWGYSDEKHRKEELARRATIITHSRISKRLLSLMHVENMRGNHVASEMTPQTVALLHGLKGVYAPHPVFMDRQWTGSFVNKWFNAGPDGAAGGYGSAMGWGRERRYQGSTWYYRASPPNRLFNNWMGWTDTGMGGAEWEERHGRPCLPSAMLHPIKDSQPTDKGHVTGFDLAYG